MGKSLKGKELGKGIRQRTDGTYVGRYNDRFGNRKCVYSLDLKKCKEKFAKAVSENNLKLNISDDNVTLDQWYKIWLETYKSNIRDGTMMIYDNCYKKHISPTLGNMRICNILTLDVKRLLNTMEKNGMSYEMQNKSRILILDMFDKAIMDNLAIKNPARGIKIEREEYYERRVLSMQEQNTFFECSAGTFYNNFYCVQILTGLRPGELFALTTEDIDFEKHNINVCKTLTYQKYLNDTRKEFHIGKPKTKQSTRIVPMNTNCEKYIKKQMKLRDYLISTHDKDKRKCDKFGNLIFISDRCNPMCVQTYNDSIQRILNEINRQLPEIEKIQTFSGHSFRHTFATRCIENGVQPKTLQKYLGHATLQMTMDLYVHVTEDFKHEEIDKIDDGLFEIIV